MDTQKVATICRLNDEARKAMPTLPNGGVIMMTYTAACLPQDKKTALLNLIKNTNEFVPTNSLSHDSGDVVLDGKTYAWWFEYQTKDWSKKSNKPDNAELTLRILYIAELGIIEPTKPEAKVITKVVVPVEIPSVKSVAK